MTVEMTCLFWSVVLTLVLAVIAVTGAMLQVGLPTLAGNRENMPEITAGPDEPRAPTATCLKAWYCFPLPIP